MARTSFTCGFRSKIVAKTSLAGASISTAPVAENAVPPSKTTLAIGWPRARVSRSTSERSKGAAAVRPAKPKTNKKVNKTLPRAATDQQATRKSGDLRLRSMSRGLLETFFDNRRQFCGDQTVSFLVGMSVGGMGPKVRRVLAQEGRCGVVEIHSLLLHR